MWLVEDLPWKFIPTQAGSGAWEGWGVGQKREKWLVQERTCMGHLTLVTRARGSL